MSNKIFHNRRDFLNPKGHWDTGAISSKVSADADGVESDISIWDCGKKITLSFYTDDEKSGKQRSKKIQLMIDHLLGVQKALGEAYDHFLIEKDKQEDKE